MSSGRVGGTARCPVVWLTDRNNRAIRLTGREGRGLGALAPLAVSFRCGQAERCTRDPYRNGR